MFNKMMLLVGQPKASTFSQRFLFKYGTSSSKIVSSGDVLLSIVDSNYSDIFNGTVRTDADGYATAELPLEYLGQEIKVYAEYKIFCASVYSYTASEDDYIYIRMSEPA